MLRYIVRRIIYSVFALLGVSLITFLAVFASGDPVALMLPPEAGLQEIEEFRQIMGLDKPLHVQYIRFLGRALQGDFGRSLRYQVPAMPLVLERLPATMELAFGAILLAAVIGIPLGVIAATRHGSLLDEIVVSVSALGLAAPTFWIGIMLILLFAVRFPIFPPSGGGSLNKLVLPLLTLALGRITVLVRFTRSGMIDVLSREYVVTAQAKGLHPNTVLFRHALRNTLIPIVTLLGLQMGTLLGGAVITENVFAWPGIGRIMVLAVYNRDFPLVVSAVLVAAAMFIVINLFVDVLYAYVNPTIRYH